MRHLAAILLPLLLWGETISRYDVPKMHCPLCTIAVKKSLKDLPGVHRVEVRLNTKQATVWHDDTLTDRQIRDAIATTGYSGYLVPENNR
jgi:mercuric ion binding protein